MPRMPPVNDSSRLERGVFDWFSKRSPEFAAAAPVVVFLVVLIGGLSIATVATARTLDAYVGWVFLVALAAGMALYVTAIYSFGGVLDGSRRYRLLRLHQTIVAIRAMNWRDFEDLVEAYLQERGFDVEHQGHDTADGGVDLVARKHGTVWLVQCKHWRNDWVGEPAVRDLLGVVKHRKADGGFLVCCGDFDAKAREFVTSSPEIRLVGAEMLQGRLREVLENREARKEAVAPPPG